jgi:hypothetical protein
MEGFFEESLPGDDPLEEVMANLFQMEEVLSAMADASGLGPVFTEYHNFLYLFLAGLKKFPELSARMDRTYASLRNQLVELMQRAVERGEIRADVDREAVAYEITAFYEGALLLSIFNDRKEYTVLGPRVFDSIWRRIARNTEQEGGNE